MTTSKREVRPDQHGTPTGYNYGCRCLECRKSRAEYRSARRSLLKGAEMRSVQHGTADGYQSYGCRCDECTLSHSEKIGRSRHKKEYADGPSWKTLQQWAISLGLPSLPRPCPKSFADRWNREHPDNPYMGKVK